MKTKNFILPAIALAIFAAPVIAQDYHEKELKTIQDSVMSSVSPYVKQLASNQNYLNIALLMAQINEDLPIDLKQLKEVTQKSIKNNKISLLEQYTLMDLCMVANRNDVLATLIEAGFNPTIDIKLDFISLAAHAVEYNNVEAFGLTFTFDNKARTIKVIEDLEKIDPSLVNRFFKFVKKCETNGTFEKQPVCGTNQQKNTTGVIKGPTHGAKHNKNASTTTTNEEGIIGAYYYNENGTLVIKKFNKTLSEDEYKQWLQENETMMKTKPNVADYERVLDSIRRQKK